MGLAAADPGPDRCHAGLHALGSLWTIRVLFWATVAVLLFTRRFRHLFVFVGAVVGAPHSVRCSPTCSCDPALGVEILGDWTGALRTWSPGRGVHRHRGRHALQLVPQGRLRQLGKLAIAGLVTALSISWSTWVVNSPTDVLIGAIIGVTIPLVAFRLLAPNEVFPVASMARSSAHLDVGGRRRRGHPPGPRGPAGHPGGGDQAVRAVGLAGLTPLRVCAKGDPNTYFCSPSCMPAAISAPTAGTSWAGRCCTAAWRTRSRSTPSAALVQQEDYALRLLYGAGAAPALRDRGDHPRARVPDHL